LPVPPPRGIDFDVSGTVYALGKGVTNVNLGDLVFGVPDYIGYPTGGAAEYAILKVFTHSRGAGHQRGCRTSDGGRDSRSLHRSTAADRRPDPYGQRWWNHDGVRCRSDPLLRSVHVIASAGETFAGRLRRLGAKVTPYGDGMVERVRELAGGATDFALHTAQVKGILPDLVKIVDGDPNRVFSFADRDEEGIGVRTAWQARSAPAMTCSATTHNSPRKGDFRFQLPKRLP
jgi:hypothetical protein